MSRRWLMNCCLQFYRVNGCKPLDYRVFAKTRNLCSLSTAVKVSSKETRHSNKKGKSQSKKKEEKLVLNITEEQSKNILKDLNNRTLDQLTNTKNIGKNKAEALLKFKQDHGPLTDLTQLNNIKGYGKAFFSWLEQNGELPPTTKKFSRQHEILGFLISDEQKQDITNIVSIDIGLSNAAWVQMDKDRNVLAWKQMHITKPKPYNPASFKPQVQEFVDSLPQTDAFIVEMQSHRVGKHAASLLPFVIHLRILEAMLHCLLQSPVIPMDPHYTSKYFKLPPGHSQKKKAAISLVQSLFLEKKDVTFEVECENFLKEKSGLEGSEILVGGLVGVQGEAAPTQSNGTSSLGLELKLQISEHLIQYFQSCKKKDDLSDCLLQGLAFYNLLAESQE